VRRLAAILLFASLILSGPLTAQSQAGRLLDQARTAIEEFQPDSAAEMINRALRLSNITDVERQRAFVTIGAIALVRSNGADRIGARNAFVQALRINAAYLLPDDLADQHSDMRAVYREAQQIVPATPTTVAAAPLTGQLELVNDTTIPVDSGRYRLTALVNRRARVAVIVTPADVPSQIVWADTQAVTASGSRYWNLRARDGSPLSGRYAIRLTATDSAGQVFGPIERVITVGRVAVDTAAHPPALAATAFQPETLRLRRGSPAALLVGFGVAAAAAVLPSALGNADLNSGLSGDATSIAVAGVASLAGIVGFLKGQRVRYSPENARANAELRQRDATQRADLARRNRALLDEAPVRVRVER
jgi:hypothetical protein